MLFRRAAAKFIADDAGNQPRRGLIRWLIERLISMGMVFAIVVLLFVSLLLNATVAFSTVRRRSPLRHQAGKTECAGRRARCPPPERRDDAGVLGGRASRPPRYGVIACRAAWELREHERRRAR